MKVAVFLERNGILNSARDVNHHPCSPLTLDQFHINTDAIAPVRQLKELGFLLIATANQPELSQGTISRNELDRMHSLLMQTFDLDDVMICPHDEPDCCPCRKPRPGLLIEASHKWHLNLDRSFVISDKWQDAESARAVGCTSLLLESPWNGNGHHDFVLPTIEEIVAKIEKLHASQDTFA